MGLNLATGQWDDDEHPDGGLIGEQLGAPMAPMQMPPPVAQAPGPEMPSPPPPVNPTAPQPPAIPDVKPVEPIAPAPIPVGRVVSPAESANFASIDQNSAGMASTAQDKGQLNAVAAQAELDAANQGETAAQQFLKERAAIAADAKKNVEARAAQAQADYQKYKEFGIKDPEADKSFGRRLMEAIVSGLGAYNASMNHVPNQALEIIQAATKDNIDRQKAQQQKLLEVSQRSGKDVEQAKADRDDAFHQLDLKHSALLESSAATLRAQLARVGVPQAQIDANTDIQTLEKDSLQKREDALKGIRDNETELAKADIAAAARRAKRAGTGGGSTDALSKFAERAGALAPGEAIPGDLVALGRAAGLKPNQISEEVQRYRDSGDKSKGIDNKANSAGAGGIGSVRQNAVLGNLAEAEKAAAAVKPGVITPDDVAKLQTNKERSDAAHHAAESGAVGSIAASIMRGTGLAPRGEFDGIDPAKQKLVTAAQQVITHLTEMQQGKNQETLEQYYHRYYPYLPGLSVDEMRRREAALPSLVAEQRATQDPTGVGRKRLDAAETTGPGPARGARPAGPDPRIAAAQGVLNDPAKAKLLSPAERAFLLKTVRGAKTARPAAPANNGGEPMDDITL
jgi:hypothetical protein